MITVSRKLYTNCIKSENKSTMKNKNDCNHNNAVSQITDLVSETSCPFCLK